MKKKLIQLICKFFGHEWKDICGPEETGHIPTGTGQMVQWRSCAVFGKKCKRCELEQRWEQA